MWNNYMSFHFVKSKYYLKVIKKICRVAIAYVQQDSARELSSCDARKKIRNFF